MLFRGLNSGSSTAGDSPWKVRRLSYVLCVWRSVSGVRIARTPTSLFSNSDHDLFVSRETYPHFLKSLPRIPRIARNFASPVSCNSWPAFRLVQIPKRVRERSAFFILVRMPLCYSPVKIGRYRERGWGRRLPSQIKKEG